MACLINLDLTWPYSIRQDTDGFAIIRDGRIVVSYIDDIADAEYVVNQLNHLEREDIC